MLPWYVLGLLAAACWSVHVVLGKKVLFKQHAIQYITLFSLIGLILILPFSGRVVWDLEPLVYVLLFVDSLLWVSALVLAFKALRHMEVSQYIPLENLSVLVVLFFGVFLLGEELKAIHYLGIFCLVGGGIWLCSDNLHVLWKDKKFLLFGLAASILYGLSEVFDKIFVSPQTVGLSFSPVDAFSLFFLERLLVVLNFIGLTFLWYGGFKDVKMSWSLGGHWVLLSAAFDMLANYFYFSALPLAYVSLLVPITRLYTIFDVLIGGRFFHDHRLVHRFLSCGLMLLGVYLVVG
ncbi:MAG: DMT family transporter [Nanoarchaeota archaeon]